MKAYHHPFHGAARRPQNNPKPGASLLKRVAVLSVLAMQVPTGVRAEETPLSIRLSLKAPWTLESTQAWSLNGNPMDPGSYQVTPTATGLEVRNADGSYGANLAPPLLAHGELLAVNGHHYRGDLQLRKDAIVNRVGLQQYLYSVVAREIGGGAEMEALKAQAVVARTYVTAHARLHEVSDDTSFQVYSGADGETAASRAAVDATEGEVLTYSGRLARHVCYHSTCGGVTEANENVFLTSPIPYLRSVACTLETSSGMPPSPQTTPSTDLPARAALPYQPKTWIPSVPASSPPLLRQDARSVPATDSSLMEALAYAARHPGRYGAKLAGARTMLPAAPPANMSAPSPIMQASRPAPLTIEDRACARSGYADWMVPLEREHYGTVTVLERTAHGRVLRVRVGAKVLAGDEIRRVLKFRGKDGKPMPLYSTYFEVINDNGVQKAVGHGWGHGVGLCQWGARGMAGHGTSYLGILEHYFPATHVTHGEQQAWNKASERSW